MCIITVCTQGIRPATGLTVLNLSVRAFVLVSSFLFFFKNLAQRGVRACLYVCEKERGGGMYVGNKG